MIIAGKIKSVEEWFCKAPPKGKEKQWKDGNSAKEFAKLWFNKKGLIIPEKISEIITTTFGSFNILFALPEYVSNIDEVKGEQRNHDMLLFCKTNDGEDFIVCIEAKVSESLGDTVGKQRESGKNKEGSRIPGRIKLMQKELKMQNTNIDDLYYQLFTGAVGTINEAKSLKVGKCLFLVLQIIPQSLLTKNGHKKFENNLQAIKDFIIANKAKAKTDEEDLKLYKLCCDNKNLEAYLGYLQVNV